MIANCNDGTNREPYLRNDICIGNLDSLPHFSSGPTGSEVEIYKAIKQAGFDGIQGGNARLCHSVGLGATAGDRINHVGEVQPKVKEWMDEGFECATLHVGWGMEDESALYALVEDILNTSITHSFPLYIETHRATITQDIWRTVKLTEKFPEIRFNGDFSHWYTGLEMVYGGIENKLKFLEPVFQRVRFLHGRIGHPGCIQVDIGDGKDREFVEHFKMMWRLSFKGFLKRAKPGDYICFAPELLPPEIYYASLIKGPGDSLVESGDRWEQAILYRRIAQECFDDAKRELSQNLT